MPFMNDLVERSAVEQAALVRAGAISSAELVELYLERIARLDRKLASFVAVLDRSAIATARKKDEERRRSRERLPPFHGVPIGIKDLNFVRGARTRLGSRGFSLWSPVDDRTTARLRRAGFVIVGKLATSELGALPITEPDIHPPTRNPWRLDTTPGGSSGGSGAAVAAGLIPIAHGSDGAGSIRIPASFCHLVGLKPARGRVPNAYGLPDKNILYTCGPIARTVEDAAVMLDVMAGITVDRPHWAPRPERPFAELMRREPGRLRVKLIVENPLAPTHPEIAAATVRAAKTLESLGHVVEEGALPALPVEEFLPLWQRLVAGIPLVDWRKVQPVTRWLAEAGKRVPRRLAAARAAELAALSTSVFGDADVILSPTVSMTAPSIGMLCGRSPEEIFFSVAPIGAFTAAFNLTGQPAASMPMGLTSDGLPIGVQIGGKPFAEATVLQVMHQLEAAHPSRHLHPPPPLWTDAIARAA
jgi:amidase